MNYIKVIARKNLPSRFPFGVVAFLLWVADHFQSTLFYWLVFMYCLIPAAVVMFRQFSEMEVELKDLQNEGQIKWEEESKEEQCNKN